MPKTYRRLSKQEREQRRTQNRERLQQAAEQLLESTGWQRWVRARARNGLARYSVSNLCLILLANPQASFVAGFKAWLELGYCVRKGERAIRIFAPMPSSPSSPPTQRPTTVRGSCFGSCRCLTALRSMRWMAEIRLRLSRHPSR